MEKANTTEIGGVRHKNGKHIMPAELILMRHLDNHASLPSHFPWPVRFSHQATHEHTWVRARMANIVLQIQGQTG
jgi:hypothetical protein